MDNTTTASTTIHTYPKYKCHFCAKEDTGLLYRRETDLRFHFDCWVKDIIDKRVDERLRDLKIK